jgi:Xaa-Pro aminopeptidase
MTDRIPPARYGDRLAAARAALRERGAAALLVGVGPQLRWLTGYAAMPLERLSMLVLPSEGPATLVVPRLERDPAGRAPASAAGLLTVETWGETDDATLVVAGVLPKGADRGRLLLSDHLWALHVLSLQRRFPAASFGLATDALRELRAVKDADEIASLRAAGAAADRVMDAVIGGRLIGRTEAEVSAEIRDRLIAEGHQQADFAIVGSGPNSASPHHEASHRRLAAGEALVLDLGGVMAGYCSDTTRTAWLTGGDAALGPSPEFAGLYEVLQRSQAAATAAVRPGVACEAIDDAARSIIAGAGWGPNFLHRTGHGIGLEVHEEPYMVAGNAEPLRVGHAFSIEPGIYLEGRYGARIEDIVACGAQGADVLNRTSRELRVVSGT